MAITAFPLQASGKTFGQEPTYRMLDHLFTAGVVSGLGVVQNPAGADMSVTVQPGDAYVAMTSGGKRLFINGANSNSGVPGVVNDAEWLATFTAAHSTNPRIDRVVSEVQDSLVDGGSGQYRGMFRVVPGTATSGADLTNLSGAPALPANCAHVRYVRVPAGATSLTDADIGTGIHPALAGGVVGSRVPQAFTASGSIAAAGGRDVTFSGASGQTLNLPAAVVGMEFTVHNIGTTNGVTVARGGTDTILDNLTSGAVQFRIPPGAAATFRVLAAGVWVAKYDGPVAKAGALAVTSGTGNKLVTGVGFRPRMIEFSGAHASVTGSAFLGHGCADASGSQWVQAVVREESGAVSSATRHATDACVAIINALGGTIFSAAFVSMDADGFTLNWTTVNTNGRVGWRAYA